MEKKELKKRLASLDLFLIDIDDTIAPHMTVGIANTLARDVISSCFFNEKLENPDHIITTKENVSFILKSFFKNKIVFTKNKKQYKDLFFVLYYGIKLHILKLLFNLTNASKIYHVSNECLINNFLLLLKKTNTNITKYQYNNQQLQKSLFPGVKEFLEKIKTTKIAMSQSFDVGTYKQLLHFDKIIDNNINKIQIKNSNDKYRIAKNLSKDKKEIGILMNDYEDEELLKLSNVKLIIMKSPPWRLKKKADVIIQKEYEYLL